MKPRLGYWVNSTLKRVASSGSRNSTSASSNSASWIRGNRKVELTWRPDSNTLVVLASSRPSSMRTVTGKYGIGRSAARSEEHTSELQSRGHLVCRLLLEKKK